MKKNMLAIITVLIGAIMLMLSGCGTTKHIPKDSMVTQDSVRVEYQERVVFVPDTVYIEIPRQTAERITKDSISFLENDYAYSSANISNGFLSHSLTLKEQSKPIPIKEKVIYRDSVVYKNRYIDRKVTEYVDKEIPKWLKLIFWGCLGFTILVLIKYIKKLF